MDLMKKTDIIDEEQEIFNVKQVGDNYNAHIPLDYDLGITKFEAYDPWSEMYEYGANTPELEYLNYINSSTF